MKSIVRRLKLMDLLLIGLAVGVPVYLYQFPANSVLHSYAISVSASVVFVLIVRFSDFYQSVARHIAFVDFVGPDVNRNEVYIIYPEFELNPKVREEAAKILKDKQLIFRKTLDTKMISRIDVNKCAASNDLQAVNEISALLSKHTSVAPPVVPDGDWDNHQNRSFISVGFSSNVATLMWLQHNKHALLRQSDPPTRRYSDFIQVLSNKDGEVESITFKSTPGSGNEAGSQVGVIARCRPDRERPELTWFICAGVGADATVASALYLTRKWRKIQQIAKDRDFLFVTKCTVGLSSHPKGIHGVVGGKIIDMKRSGLE